MTRSILTALILAAGGLLLTPAGDAGERIDPDDPTLRPPHETDDGPCSSPESHQFDFWIGSWSMDNRQRSPSRPEDPTWFEPGSFRTDVGSVLGGCLIMERSTGTLSYGPISGFSLRAYDPAKERWKNINHWSVGGGPPAFSSWEGSFRHGRIEGFDTTRTSGGSAEITRATFSDITDSTFRWDSAASRDEGLTWKPTWIMEGVRLASANAEPITDPLTGAPPCSEETREQIRNATGAWKGRVIGSTYGAVGVDAEVNLDAFPIHGGCAFATLLETVDGSYGRASIRAEADSSGHWTGYVIDVPVRRFRIVEGTSLLDMVSPAGDGSRLSERERWTSDGRGGLTVAIDEQADDRSWSQRLEIAFERRRGVGR